ncbi:hypothetical protein ACOSQ4_030838 [Xanthoceras sorbifolium]
MIPHQLGNLSKLQYLNFGSNSPSLYVENFSWLSGVTLLKYLDLSNVRLNKSSDWLQVVNTLSSLQELRLSECELYHLSPLPFINISSLVTLDLSGNLLNHIPSWISSLSNLVFLDLSSNSFQGLIPHKLQNLTVLRHLDLGYNRFNSSIPDWLYRFSSLEFLSLAGNDLRGKISDALRNLTSIETIDLSFNRRLEGKLSRSLGKFCKLKSISFSQVKMNQDITEVLDVFSSGCVFQPLESLDLSNCTLSGQLTSSQLLQFKDLLQLDLSDNSISGSIPESLGGLSSLRYLYLSNNKLNGTLSEIHFTNLLNLQFFFASENSLTLKFNSNWVPHFQLEELHLRSCHLGPQFPSWLQSQKRLSYIDISNSKIYDSLPNWFWKSSFQINFLNLSSNQIYGKIPHLTEATHIKFRDLSSNNLSGSLPLTSSNVIVLDLSNNSMSGSLSHFLCYEMNKSKKMQILNLKSNLLSGQLPDYWVNWQYLFALNLASNEFTGKLPISLGTLGFLQSPHLQENQFSGTILVSLSNCRELKTLDVSNNELVGNVPTWIDLFPSMMILNLRSNKLHGLLPLELCRLSSLQILDIAYNNISGTIPRCINNFNAMVAIDQHYVHNDIIYGPKSLNETFEFGDYSETFVERQLLVIKGREAEYSGILNLVRTIDLSNNHLSREIPIEVTSLRGLRFLNLSHNLLTGRIPESIGVMSLLESIDFSANKLSGEIPQSSSNLTSFSVFNLSYNNLIGKIPSSTQLQSLDASNFIRNELCRISSSCEL